MAAGLGLLRLSPASFWALTPKELAAALRASGGGAAAGPTPRRTLEDLMQRYPDLSRDTASGTADRRERESDG
jgi:uncharacterized phage protein (TIGR02216 family)